MNIPNGDSNENELFRFNVLSIMLHSERINSIISLNGRNLCIKMQLGREMIWIFPVMKMPFLSIGCIGKRRLEGSDRDAIDRSIDRE